MNINDALRMADEGPHAFNQTWHPALPVLAAEVRRQSGIIDEQRRTIDALMVGMPEDGTTPVIRRIAGLEQEIERLRAALLRCARMAEALKRPCGMDPEGVQALRNVQYQSISTTAHIALGTIQGPALKDTPT